MGSELTEVPLVEWFLGYPLAAYREAEWILLAGPASPWLWVLLAAGCALILLTLGRERARGKGVSGAVPRLAGGRLLTIALVQCVLLALVLALLWRPALRISTASTTGNTLAVIYDTSTSMQQAYPGGSRLDQVRAKLADESVLEKLAESFTIREFNLGDSLSAVDSGDNSAATASSASPASDQSPLTDAIESLLESADEQDISAVILVSDGASTSAFDSDQLGRIAAHRRPVMTVTADYGRLEGNLTLREVRIADQVPVNTLVDIEADIDYHQASNARLRVTHQQQLLYAESFSLPEPSQASADALHTHRHVFQIRLPEAGISELQFQLSSDENEPDSFQPDNIQHRLVQVTDTKRRVLYIEGEPRWEYKFIRRALSADVAVELVTVLHTSTNKFYRQGVVNADELEQGFPKDRASLFAYDGVVIGSLEAANLTLAQQQDLLDFVRVRGGSLLMLGGKAGLADGRWSNSPVAEALPVALHSGSETWRAERVQAEPAVGAAAVSWLTPVEGGVHWVELPALANWQQTGPLKPGASELLRVSSQGTTFPLLSWQHYGQGRVYVLASSGTWRWQMQLPVEDNHHERFWQGLLAELAGSSMQAVQVAGLEPVYRNVERVNVNIMSRAPNYLPDNRSELPVEVTLPDGSVETLTAFRLSGETGQYRLSVPAPLPGAYRVLVPALASESGPIDAHTDSEVWFTVEKNGAEKFAMSIDHDFMKGLAALTGGLNVLPDEVGKLTELLQQNVAQKTEHQILPLQFVPVVFFLLLLMKCLEWLLRLKWKRL